MTIRRILQADIMQQCVPIWNYAFYTYPPGLDDAKAQRWTDNTFDDSTWIYGWFEGDRALAIVAFESMPQNVRGQVYPQAGVWGVGTLPEARRKGYIRQLMRHSFAEMRALDMPFSTLYPFKTSFYTSLGYTSFPSPRVATLKPGGLLPLLRQDLGGTIDYARIEDRVDDYRDFMREVMQPMTHGMAALPNQQRRDLGAFSPGVVAFAVVEGQRVGMMLYKLDAKTQEMTVSKFYYQTEQAKYLLLEWLARHNDQCKTIAITLPADADVNLWMDDLQVTWSANLHPMGRVVDVMQLQGWAVGAGAITLQIEDADCPWNQGVFRFAAVDGRLQVQRTSDASQGSLTIQGLSALVYGVQNPAALIWRGWGSLDVEAQTVLARMFPVAVPYLHETF